MEKLLSIENRATRDSLLILLFLMIEGVIRFNKWAIVYAY